MRLRFFLLLVEKHPLLSRSTDFHLFSTRAQATFFFAFFFFKFKANTTVLFRV